MTILVKEYETSKLAIVEMSSTGTDSWASADGKYTTTLAKDEFEDGGEILVRIPKK
jgi:hypothetical protein